MPSPGRESIQISRRLLAIFDDLEQLVADTGRPERAEAVRRQRGLLVAGVLETYPDELQVRGSGSTGVAGRD